MPIASNSVSSSPTRRTNRGHLAAYLVGPVLVLLVAWASSNIRDVRDVANVALVMAVATVVIAIVSWKAGVVTSIAAALALNYFHTEPLHTFRVTQRSDVIALALLASVGLASSAASAARVRSFARAHARVDDDAGTTLLADTSAVARRADVVWIEAIRTSCPDLAMVECRLESTGSSNLPTIARFRPVLDASATFVLPQTGAVIEMKDPRRSLSVALIPRSGAGALHLDRRMVLAFVDQLELAIDRTSQHEVGRATL